MRVILNSQLPTKKSSDQEPFCPSFFTYVCMARRMTSRDNLNTKKNCLLFEPVKGLNPWYYFSLYVVVPLCLEWFLFSIEYPLLLIRRLCGGVGYLCSTIFCTLRRLPADNVSEDEFYSILKVTEIRYKVTQSMSPQNEPTWRRSRYPKVNK